MLTSCFRLLTRVARQPATFCSEFSARQRFVRIFHYLSGISTTEFTTMSQNGDWNVQKSGKGKNRKSTPQKPKGNEKRPHTANGTGSKTAKEGSVAMPKDNETETAVESPAKDESSPWLCVSSGEDDRTKNTSTTETNTPEKKKKHKKKKIKSKDKQEAKHDANTPKGDSAETSSPQVTNGVKPDSDKTTAPKSTETKSEPQEGTGEESTKTTTAKSSESTKPDDDDAPMNWEDAVVEQDKASEDKSHAAVADEEESSASQASPAEETNKAKIPTENSEGEGSPSKKMTDSGASDKPVSFGWKKSHSNEKLQTGARERDRQGSTERKHNQHTFKKPEANPADGNSNTKRNTSARDGSHGRRSDSKEKGRHRSADGSRSDSNKMSRSGSGDRTESDSTAGSRQVPWEEFSKNKKAKHDPGKTGKKVEQGAARRPQEKEQPRIDCQPVVGFVLTEIRGDLFKCEDDDAMAHCVSEDLEMGKGIAVYFKKYFGKVGQLRAQKKKVGEVAVLQVGASYVYYMITKERYFHKPSYQTLQSSMEAMRDHCKHNNVTSLAMPQIGCGLDKLNWGVVTEIIKEVFKNTGITVKIYIFSG